MHQIPNKNNINENYRKETSINIFAIIIYLVIIIGIISFCFNLYVKNNDLSTDNIEQENLIENTSIEESNTQNDNGVSTDIDQPDAQDEDDTYQEEILYTASNGETYSIIGRLSIPNLNIDYDILSSSSTKLLKISLNRYWGSYPNQVGNMVVVGHNFKDNKFFSNLSKINIGDIVKITDSSGQTLDYSVYSTDIIDPYDNSCTSQLTDGHTEITLITCYYENGNVHATKRFVAKARAN